MRCMWMGRKAKIKSTQQLIEGKERTHGIIGILSLMLLLIRNFNL